MNTLKLNELDDGVTQLSESKLKLESMMRNHDAAIVELKHGTKLAGGILEIEKGDVLNFPLGTNTATYFARSFVGIEDRAKLQFNVYDSLPPTIDFKENKTVTLEANSHFGFTVTGKTLPKIFLGTKVRDVCDPKPTTEYLGPSFFLLSSLKTKQFAPWKVSDHPYQI